MPETVNHAGKLGHKIKFATYRPSHNVYLVVELNMSCLLALCLGDIFFRKYFIDMDMELGSRL